jgi:hypothetical protein
MSDRCRWLQGKTTSVFVILSVSICRSTQATTSNHLNHRSLRQVTRFNREEAFHLRFSSRSIQTTRLEPREQEERGQVQWEATSRESHKTLIRQLAASKTVMPLIKDSALIIMRDHNHHLLTSRTMWAERDNRLWAVLRVAEQAQMCLKASKTY